MVAILRYQVNKNISAGPSSILEIILVCGAKVVFLFQEKKIREYKLPTKR